MKSYKISIVAGLVALSMSSCDDFLNTVPKDAMSPTTTWQTPEDAQKFLVGCYDGWESGSALLYWDCGSDFGYNNFSWEGFTVIGNGSLSAADSGWSFYNFSTVRKCNTILENIDKITFTNEAEKNDIIAQVRAIRGYQYFRMGFLYGEVPIIDNYTSAQEAQVPQKSEAEIQKYVFDDFEYAIANIAEKPSAKGRIAKGAVLAMKMRAALYWNDMQKAKDAAQAIISLGQYELDSDYANLFTVKGQSSKEIILATQYIKGTYANGTVGQMYNNAEGGWSSIVPTQNLVDSYEMENGLTIKEAGSGYDEKHPFANRDPRMAMTIVYPGADLEGTIFNTLDKEINGQTNLNYPTAADNSSKTALTWRKYLYPMYDDIWDTECSPIVFRYAEVLLTWAEAENELNGPSAEVYKKIDMVRQRAGMPKVDQAKYGSKETLRQLIRRERGAEFAGEGIRRADLLRWKDGDKMLAETALNGDLMRIVGTVDYKEKDPTQRATITGREKVETRVFKPFNRYLPIPQGNLDSNKELKPTPGYN